MMKHWMVTDVGDDEARGMRWQAECGAALADASGYDGRDGNDAECGAALADASGYDGKDANDA